ncbi:MAG: alpha-hydroxy-acid oxidizing protein [Rhodothermales bacterium]|nr:alpha-hydroxy-acid oxidizing protein [Rhodothermales bacterium]MBO6780681.1 alpha-hydroxy-acid oxidizing protein [Rhodothermales bacterium]
MPRTNIEAFRRAARDRLEPMVFDYYDGGADDELTLDLNRIAWTNRYLVPRAFRDVSRIDTSTTLFGHDLAFPLLTAPCSFNRLAHPDGEIAVCDAVCDAGIGQILSTASTTSLEDVARHRPGGHRWFQLYCYKDRGLTLDLVRRAEEAGYRAICLTVDVPVAGNRERDIHNSFHLPDSIRWANLDHLMGADYQGSALTRYIHDRWEQNLSWSTIDWLRSEVRIPLVVKGVMDPRDAAAAAAHGMDGVVVSNHGGRQLDGAPGTAAMLPEVVQAVDGRIPVLVDGGIRRGADVVKALAMGAAAALIGRPYLWGLAADGRAGVTDVLDLFRSEIERTMALCGCTAVSDCPDILLR